MTTDNRNDLGKILKQRRVMIPLILQELARATGVSSSHLGPYVATVFITRVCRVQRTVIGILTTLKSIAKVVE